MLSFLNMSTSVAFNPFSAFFTALFAGIFAMLAIVFKDRYDFASERARCVKLLQAEIKEVITHFKRNIERLDAMISVVRDGEGLWPDRLHLIKLAWPEDSAFFSNNIPKYMTITTSNNIRKFRLRLRNLNLDALAAQRAYDTRDDEALLEMLQYVRARTMRLIELAPNALGDKPDGGPDFVPEPVDFRTVKDMVFLSKTKFFKEDPEEKQGTDMAAI